MKPWKTLATDGQWTLRQRDAEYMVLVAGQILMSSRTHGGEDEFAQLACARLAGRSPRVLVGGLGFGATLRAVLNEVPDTAKVTVMEPSKALLGWHRGVLAPLHEHALDDHRVTVEQGEVHRLLHKHRNEFDVAVMDLDLGVPTRTGGDEDERLAALGGLSSLRASLVKGGRLALWSPGTQAGVSKRLREVGFAPSVEKIGRGQHLVFLGDV